MNRKTSLFCVLLILASLSTGNLSCNRVAPSTDRKPAQEAETVSELPTLEVRADRDDLLFSWIDGSGAFHDVSNIEDIPPEARAQVLVRDLSRSAQELGSAEYLYVADLRIADENGRYPCGTVSRHHFERRGIVQSATRVLEEIAAAGEPVLTFYSASWCGVCTAARRFLKQKGVPFIERDIEREPAAEAELQAKAEAAGVVPQGVPVFDIAGTLLMGFDRSALTKALELHGVLSPQAAAE